MSTEINRHRRNKKAPAGASATAGPTGDLLLETLRFEFSKRVQVNPRYSLRSFARQLGVSHTLLSLILNGRRAASKNLIEALAERFNYPPEKVDLLRRNWLERSRPESGAPAAVSPQSKMSLDQFALISEWQHFAILSLLEIPGTVCDEAFIAERLGISPLLAKISLRRLKDLGIIAKNAKGRWVQTPGSIVIENTRSTEASRKYNRQLLEKAIDSMNETKMEERDVSSTTFAMHPRHVPYALQRIRDFRRQLSTELETMGDAEEVYNLTVQIFPTSKRRPK